MQLRDGFLACWSYVESARYAPEILPDRIERVGAEGNDGRLAGNAPRQGRVYLADGNQYFNRPGPRVVESLEALVEMLHPEFREARLRGSVWRVMMSM